MRLANVLFLIAAAAACGPDGAPSIDAAASSDGAAREDSGAPPTPIDASAALDGSPVPDAAAAPDGGPVPIPFPTCSSDEPVAPLRPDGGCMPADYRFAYAAAASSERVHLFGFSASGDAAVLELSEEARAGRAPQLARAASGNVAVLYLVDAADGEPEVRGRVLAGGCLEAEAVVLTSAEYRSSGTDNQTVVPERDGFAIYPSRSSTRRVLFDDRLERQGERPLEDCLAADTAAGFGPGGTAVACTTSGRIQVVTWDAASNQVTGQLAPPVEGPVEDLVLAVPSAGRVVLSGTVRSGADRTSSVFYAEVTDAATSTTDALSVGRTSPFSLGGVVIHPGGYSSVVRGTQYTWDGTGTRVETHPVGEPVVGHAWHAGRFYGFTGQALVAWEPGETAHAGCGLDFAGRSARTLLVPGSGDAR